MADTPLLIQGYISCSPRVTDEGNTVIFSRPSCLVILTMPNTERSDWKYKVSINYAVMFPDTTRQSPILAQCWYNAGTMLAREALIDLGSVEQLGIVHCITAQHGTARHGTARHGTAQHGTARHGTARHSR